MIRNWLSATRPSFIAFVSLLMLGCAANAQTAYPAEPFPKQLCADVFAGLSSENKAASTILALDDEGNLVSALTPAGGKGCEKVVAGRIEKTFPIKTDTVFTLKSLGFMGFKGSTKHAITDSAGNVIVVRHSH